VRPWVRRTALPLALCLGLSLVAPLAGAAEPAPPAAPTPAVVDIKPLTNATAAKLASIETSEAALATTQTTEPTSGDSKSFFKTPRGVLALALAAAGVGYVIYSSQNDRINSPIR
jgi:hypothetical protein